MPQNTPRKIRIYCICGQKMKVDEQMFGRNGKCIACRQKIRVPNADEIAYDTQEIYLSAHPEFLRNPPPLPDTSDQHTPKDTLAIAREIEARDKEEEESEYIALGQDEFDIPEALAENSLPLETLPALQVLCSFQHQIEKDLKRIDDADRQVDKSSLMAYRILVRRIREDVDAEMRNMMGELNSRLDIVNHDINETLVMLRLGELDYPAFQDRIVPMRRQREYFVYCIQSLQGWLMVEHPVEAGGLLPVNYDDIPCEVPQVILPQPLKPGHSLIEFYLERLRSALKERSLADKKLHELARMGKEENASLQSSDLTYSHADADARRQRVAVRFYRDRLDVLLKDCDADIKALKSALEGPDSSGKVSILDKSIRNQRQTGWQKGLTDTTLLSNLLRQALVANSHGDVPHSRKILFDQMAFTKSSRIQLDSWIVWLASLILIAGILMPFTHDITDNAAITRSVVLGFFFSASSLAAVAIVPIRLTRGFLLCAVWVIISIVWGLYIHYLRTGFLPTMNTMGRDPQWYLAPGIVVLASAFLTTGCAAVLSLYPFHRYRWIPVSALGVLLIFGMFFFSNMFGLLQPRPVYEANDIVITQSARHSGRFDVTIPLSNRGLRPMFVTTNEGGNESFTMRMRHYQSGSQPIDMPGPIAYRNETTRSWTPLTQQESYDIFVVQGGRIFLRYELPQGEYELQLTPVVDTQKAVTTLRFAIEPGMLQAQEGAPSVSISQPSVDNGQITSAVTLPYPNEAVPSQEVILTTPVVNESSDTDEEIPFTSYNLRPGVDVELRGVLHAEDIDPVFALSLHYPSGTVVNDSYRLNQEIYAPWTAHEYNPVRKTLTISDGEQLIVLERGRRITIAETGEIMTRE